MALDNKCIVLEH